jgi:O-antigen ligase
LNAIALRRNTVSFTDTPILALVAWLVSAVMFLSGLVDLPNTVSAGPVSVSAILTICYFAAGLILFPLLPTSTFLFRTTLLPLLVFVFWAVVSLTWSSAVTKGLQNVLILSVLLVTIRMSAAASASYPGFVSHFETRLEQSTLLSSACYAGSVLWFGPGSNDLFGARSFGLFALLGVAYFLSCWRYGQKLGLLGASFLTLLIGVSLSRLALGIAVVLFPLSQIPSRGFSKTLRMLVILIVVLTLSFGAVVYIDALRERFLTGDVSLKVGSFAINGSGRAAFWRVTLDSMNESPIVGKGAGSTEGLIESFFLDMRHPHSDYLRVANDYGVVGCALWITAIGTLLFRLWSSWRSADRTRDYRARLHFAAFLALIAFVLEMSMENAMVYIFVVAPLALLIGTSLGASATPARS